MGSRVASLCLYWTLRHDVDVHVDVAGVVGRESDRKCVAFCSGRDAVRLCGRQTFSWCIPELASALADLKVSVRLVLPTALSAHCQRCVHLGRDGQHSVFGVPAG